MRARRAIGGRLAIVATAALGLLLAGCAAKPEPPPPPTMVELTIMGEPDQNAPEGAAQGFPVRLDLLQLSGPAAFLRAGYFDLAEQAAGTLGADLANRDSVTVMPGGRLQMVKEIPANVTHLGIVAGYRDLDSARWREVVAVPPHKTSHYELVIGRTGLMLRLTTL